MLNMLAAMAQFEREMMLERQRDGIAKAKAQGKYKGRKPTAQAKAADAARLYREGKRVAHIAKELGAGRGSVYRAIASAPAGGNCMPVERASTASRAAAD
jgi:DNA invertase Pin-like site-specific DNA recombinase